jgi:hypothetical protein
MSIIEVLHSMGSTQLNPKERKLIGEKILEEIHEEFILIYEIDGTYSITLKQAYKWVGNEQADYINAKKLFKKEHLFIVKNRKKLNEADSMFEQTTNENDKFKDYFIKKEGRCEEIYFSVKGLQIFCMVQRTAKSNVIKKYFSNIIHNYHQKLKNENQNLKNENKSLKRKLDLDFVTQKFQMFSEQIFRVDSELKKLKDIYEMEEAERGKVYFIHEVGSKKGFKIGFTRRELEERLAELQTGSLRELAIHTWISYQDCQKLEKYLHDCFTKKHIRGEWYDLTVEEVDDIVKTLGSS